MPLGNGQIYGKIRAEAGLSVLMLILCQLGGKCRTNRKFQSFFCTANFKSETIIGCHYDAFHCRIAIHLSYFRYFKIDQITLFQVFIDFTELLLLLKSYRVGIR